MRRQNRKRKVRGVLRYVVAACLVLLLTSSILIISSEDLKASKLSVDIIEWLEEFFSVDKGEDDRRKESEVLFTEEQIGYLPDGFVKTAEFENIGVVYFKYKNDAGENIQINVVRDKSSLQIDNKDNNYEVWMNEAGYEYTYTYSDETEISWVVWKDKEDLYYCIFSTLPGEEIIKIMDNISY